MKIIIINGPMGVGKTTIGKYIANRNPKTAFIDGDWCMDLHPFVGNRETKSMAVNNILHMVDNYSKCTECKMIVLVWLMDDDWVYESIIDGIKNIGLDINSVTLICSKEKLIERWKNDTACEWRTDEWLDASIKSLSYFETLKNTLDTSELSVEKVTDKISNSFSIR